MVTNLTKEQRVEIYSVAYDLFCKLEERDSLGMCAMIKKASLTLVESKNIPYVNPYNQTKLSTNYPEFFSFKPDKDRDYWFPFNDDGRRKRLEILEQLAQGKSNKKKILS